MTTVDVHNEGTPSGQAPLILREAPVRRSSARTAVAPNIAMVYATAAGRLGYFDGRPLTWREQLVGSYRYRYYVYTGDLRFPVPMSDFRLPSRGDCYFFEARVDVGIRVHDPEEIVRRNARDALPIVLTHLGKRFRPITRIFDIEESEPAENAIIDQFREDTQLPEGVTIFDIAVELLPDREAMQHLQQKRQAERELLMNRARHTVMLEEIEQRGQLADLEKDFELRQARRQLQELEGHNMDSIEIIKMHLAQHPRETERVLGMLTQHREALMRQQDLQQRHSTALWKLLADKGLLKRDEIEPLIAQAKAAGSLPGWMPPPPGEMEVEGRAEFSTAFLEPTSSGDDVSINAGIVDSTGALEVGMAIPVYALVDESVESAVPSDELASGLSALIEGLQRERAASSLIRLSILGFADRLNIRLPLASIGDIKRVPRLSQDGSAHYGLMFEALAACIADDMRSLEDEVWRIQRPIVFLLANSASRDDWISPFKRLTDSDLASYSPTVVACTLGGSAEDLVAAIATRGHEAYVPGDGLDPGSATKAYWEFVTRRTLELSRAVLEDRDFVPVTIPAAFRKVASQI
jgi:uncharacterized protein YegL